MLKLPPVKLPLVDTPVDNGQSTHLIRVCLNILLYNFFRVDSGFPFLIHIYFPVLQFLHMFLEIHCAISTRNVQKHQTT